MIPTPKLNDSFSQLVGKFLQWAGNEEDIRAAILVGSRARQFPPPDEWSDLDIMIYARHPEHYLKNTDWVAQVGEVWIQFQNQTAGGEPEILALFNGGFNIDFVFNSIESLQQFVQDGSIPYGHWRGAMVLLDKDELAKQTIPSAFHPPLQPLSSPDEFSWLVNAFWYTAHYTAKQLRRGDFWLVKIRDGNLKEAILRMLEWHSRAKDPSADTWHNGRFYQNWADPRACKELDDIFGRFDIQDSWRALFATIHLFSWLASETSERLNYPYPFQVEQCVTDMVQQLYMEDPRIQALKDQ